IYCNHILSNSYETLTLTRYTVNFFLNSAAHLPALHSFPTRRSSDLPPLPVPARRGPGHRGRMGEEPPHRPRPISRGARRPRAAQDRKSTRLNSSHLGISYAVFCLKKKKKITTQAVVADSANSEALSV